MYTNCVAPIVISTPKVSLQLHSFHQLMPKSLYNVNTMHISDLWEKKSDLGRHEFQTICATRYDDMVATMTVVKKVTFFCSAFTQTIQMLQWLKHYINIYVYDYFLPDVDWNNTFQNLCVLMPKDWYGFHKCASSYPFTELGPKTLYFIIRLSNGKLQIKYL